jgi:hypothetical protein
MGSSATVAASAVEGFIADPAPYLQDAERQIGAQA